MSDTTDVPLDYDRWSVTTCAEVRDLARELNRPIGTLIALAPNNDPFFIRESRQEAAQWFLTEIWEPLALSGLGAGVHLRRLHYLIVSQPPDQRPNKRDGMRYENTVEDWEKFQKASLAARELEQVDAALFRGPARWRPPGRA